MDFWTSFGKEKRFRILLLGGFFAVLLVGEIAGSFIGTRLSRAKRMVSVLGTSISNTDGACTNGTIRAVAKYSADRMVVGGSFTQVGPCVGSGVPLSDTNDKPVTGFSRANAIVGSVSAAIPDGAGGWYVGGDITSVGGTARTGLVHVDATGQLDPVFLPNLVLNGTVRALALNAGQLYIGGSFAGVTAKYGAPVDTSGIVPLGFYQNGTFSGSTINAAIPDGSGGWYVGGLFTSYRSIAVKNFAHLNADGTLDQTLLPNPDNAVMSLYLNGSTLYVGGSFTMFGGVKRTGAAALSVVTGTPTAFNAQTLQVNAIDKNASGDILVGGSFGSVEAHIGGAGTLDASTGAPDLNFPIANGDVSAVIPDGAGGWYIGGSFTTVNGVTRNRLAQIDSSGNLTSWNPEIGSKDKLLFVLDTHGAPKGTGQITHSVVASDGKFNMDSLDELRRYAAEKDVKFAIVDLSCYSGATQDLAGPKTCVISGSTSDNFSYTDMANRLSLTLKSSKGENSLEDLFLDARMVSWGPGQPMISSDPGKKASQAALLATMIKDPRVLEKAKALSSQALDMKDALVKLGGDFQEVANNQFIACEASIARTWDKVPNGQVCIDESATREGLQKLIYAKKQQLKQLVQQDAKVVERMNAKKFRGTFASVNPGEEPGGMIMTSAPPSREQLEMEIKQLSNIQINSLQKAAVTRTSARRTEKRLGPEYDSKVHGIMAKERALYNTLYEYFKKESKEPNPCAEFII